MAEEPDRLRQDIELTRASLTRDVDRLADKTSPRRVAQRRWTAVKEKVMGSAEQARHAAGGTVSTVQDKASTVGGKVSAVGDKAAEAGHGAADAVRNAPHAVAQQAQGNPLAAGVIAFGVGMLAATLLPVTDTERRAGQQIKENSGDLTDRVKEVASDLGSEFKQTAQESVQQVKETAQDAAQTTRQQAQSSAQDAAQQTRQAATTGGN
jgi:gas vesicle protein